jgi:TonB family protein
VKNSLIKKVFGRVSIVHGIIILLAIVLSTFRGCTPKPKNINFFDLTGGPAPAPASGSEPETDIEPAPEIKSEKPKPKPEPKPEKKEIPKPVVTNKPPETVKTNAPPKPKPVVTNAPPKPKTLEERLKEVRKGGKPVPAKPGVKPGPQLDFSGIKSALNSAATGSGSASGTSSGSASGTGSGSGGGVYSPFAGYYDSVKQQMYAVWQQPAGAPIGLTATATIQIERNGTVSSKSLTRRSGNAPFDQSVQNALNATVQLPVPPPDLPSRTIEIEFVLSD